MLALSQTLKRSIPAVVALALVLGVAAPGLADNEKPSPPDVGENYQEAIDTAWAEAGAGEDPSMTCARVKGRVMGTGDESAFRALFACNVDIPARYFNSYLDGVAAGENTCPDLMREVMTKLPAMTMSADLVLEMAEKLEQGENSESAVAETLGAAATGALDEDGLKDPKRLVKDRIAERTNELCPNFASVIIE